MADVKVETTQDNATLLLAAAEKDEQDPGVVRSTSKGHFLVDEALAKKAGVEYTTEADVAKAFEAQVKADDEATGFERDTAAPRKRAAAKKAASKTTASKE